MLSSNCKRHGQTTNVIKAHSGYYRCRECYNMHAKNSYQKNKTKYLEKEKIRYRTHGRLEKEQKRIALKTNNPPHSKCRIHGYTENVVKCGAKDRFGFPQYRCKICWYEYLKARYSKKLCP